MKPIASPGCFVCGRVEKCGGSEVCFDCSRVPSTSWVYNRSVVEYTESIKQMVHIYKYKGNEKLAEPLGLWMAELFYREFHNKGISLITYAPLSGDRLRERGFNQAQRLAQRIAKQVKLPLVELLTRSHSHSSQSKRNRQERLLSVNNVIHLSDQVVNESIQNKGILIVDDVYTTGTTLRACARPLVEGGASSIYALTFAR
jgi:competence protein ComFC